MSAFQWTALAFALIWITWKILDRGAESVAILLRRFRHDGNRSVSAPDSNSTLVDVPSVSVGHPFAVDASNGLFGNSWSELWEVLRTPSVWHQLYPFSAKWDAELTRLLDNGERFRVIYYDAPRGTDHPNKHECVLGPYTVWVSNHPYASFQRTDVRVCARRATILRAHRVYIQDMFPGFRSETIPAVDASNGSLTKTEREDIRRLGGLVEFHRVPEGVVPPKSRPMRRTIH